MLRANLVFFLLLILALPVFGSQITKVGKNPAFFLISQESTRPWKKGDEVCVQTTEGKNACGTVLAANNKAASVRLASSAGGVKVAVGDVVVRSDAGDRSPSSAGTEETGVTMPSDNISQAQVSAELGGPGLFYSIYGSYRFAGMFCANVGLSYLSVSAASGPVSVSETVFQVPLSVSLLLGGDNSFFEALAGGDLVFAGGSGSYSVLGGGFSGTTLLPEFGVGYRYWPKAGGFHFRALLMGLVLPSASASAGTVTASAGGFVPWGGLSFGYAF